MPFDQALFNRKVKVFNATVASYESKKRKWDNAENAEVTNRQDEIMAGLRAIQNELRDMISLSFAWRDVTNRA